jgi:hypothetical protein
MYVSIILPSHTLQYHVSDVKHFDVFVEHTQNTFEMSYAFIIIVTNIINILNPTIHISLKLVIYCIYLLSLLRSLRNLEYIRIFLTFLTALSRNTDLSQRSQAHDIVIYSIDFYNFQQFTKYYFFECCQYYV